MEKQTFFRESKLAHQYLDGLRGLEIGGSAHNPFGLNTKNIDITTSQKNIFKKEEVDKCGCVLEVDITASGDNLPVADESQDFIVSSHVLEHFFDPIKALKEWYRVVKKGGYIFMIIPHKERTFDRDRARTTLSELLKRHKEGFCPKAQGNHYSFWITEDLLELIDAIDLDWKIVDFQDEDDKVGNGFTIVIKKEKKDLAKDAPIKQRILEFKGKKKQEQKRQEFFPKILIRTFGLAKNIKREFSRNGILGIVKRGIKDRKWNTK